MVRVRCVGGGGGERSVEEGDEGGQRRCEKRASYRIMG